MLILFLKVSNKKEGAFFSEENVINAIFNNLEFE